MIKFKYSIISLVLISIICIFFTGCSGKEAKRPDLSFDYQCSAEITSGDNSYTAKLMKQAGVWSITFNSPDALNGMVITYENQECKISYRDMSFYADRDNVPEAGVSTLITKSLDYFASNSKASFSSKKDTIIATGIMNGGDVEMIFTDKGIPEKLEIKGNNLKVDFSDFEKL